MNFRLWTSLSVGMLIGSLLLCDGLVSGSQSVSVDPAAAERGLENLLHQPYSFGNPIFTMSRKTFDQLYRVWPSDQRAKAAASPESRRKMAFERYGLVEASFDNHGAPLGFAVTAKGTWEANCLACHAGNVAGRTIIGRANSRFDVATLTEDIAAYRTSTGDFADLTTFEEIVFKETLKQLPNVPAVAHPNVGVMNVWTTGSFEAMYRDSDLTRRLWKRDDIEMATPNEMVPPPWWNVKRKTRYGWDGFAPLNSRTIMLSTLTLVNSPALIQSWDTQFQDVLAYINSVEVPAYHGPVDFVQAGKGKNLFDHTCAHCHGTYGDGSAFPEKLVSLDNVGTDPVRATTGVASGYKKFLQESWLGYFGEAKYFIEPRNGYIAPPLDGIWAAAPYFHNGSVPTLRDVLYPNERPKVWKVADYDAYDDRNAGFVVERLEKMPEGLTPVEQRRYFDSTNPGKSNAGHTFADDFGFSDDDKSAVLEYLKTL